MSRRFGTIGRALRPRRFDPTAIVWVLLALLLIFMVVSPLLRLVTVSLEDADSGAFSVDNYGAAYGRWRHIVALANTLQMGAGVVLLSLVFAVPLAWACSRSDMPGRNLVRILVLGAFITPPYLSTMGWIMLAGPNSGWLNRIWTGLTGSEAPLVDIFSFEGLVLIMAGHLFFYLFVFISNALDLVSSEVEDAANILGAGTLRTTLRITLPLIIPAILGGAIITFLQSIALFGVPALIAPAARFPVVTTQLWEFFEFPVRVGVAAAYAIPLLAITVLLFVAQKIILSRKGFVSVTGKGADRRPVRLGRWRWPMFAYAMFVCLICTILPALLLLQAAFSRAWGRGFGLDNLTLDNFAYLFFGHSTAVQSILNSLEFAALSATFAVTLSICIAYIVSRRLLPLAGTLGFLCLAPIVVPGIVLAIGFYASYGPPPLALYGTATIMVLAFSTRFLPLAYMNSAAAVRSLHPEMEEAVRILGGSRLTAVRRVVAPLLKRSLAGSWILVFVPAAQELSTAIFLVGPQTRVMSVLLLDLNEQGNLEGVAALGCTLLVLVIGIVAVGFRIVGRDFMLRRS
jgi:iron(III) transport system permease protein